MFRSALLALALCVLTLPGCAALDEAFGVQDPPPATTGDPQTPPLTERGEKVVEGVKTVPELDAGDVIGIAAVTFPQYAPIITAFGLAYTTWREAQKKKKAEQDKKDAQAVNENLIRSFEPLIRKATPEDKQLLTDTQTPATKAAVDAVKSSK